MATLRIAEFRFPEIQTMNWFGASVIAPRSYAPIEFEIAAQTGVLTGYFHDSMFYSDGEAAGYPRKLVRRWRYRVDESVPLSAEQTIGK